MLTYPATSNLWAAAPQRTSFPKALLQSSYFENVSPFELFSKYGQIFICGQIRSAGWILFLLVKLRLAQAFL